MERSDLGDRMKRYESVSKTRLTNRTPVIIRIDGKAFHTFTRGLKKPFDDILIEAMQDTMKFLCENIQGCVLGYTQSDEISLLLVDYKNLNSCAWFDNEVQKICSVAASMATLRFNRIFRSLATAYRYEYEDDDNQWNYLDRLKMAMGEGAMFDARCFNLPKEEVTNYFFWRQQDAERNSINSVGFAFFSHQEMQNKNCGDVKEMLLLEKGIDWDEFQRMYQRGSCCIKHEEEGVSWWMIDKDIPKFIKEGREYVDRYVFI